MTLMATPFLPGAVQLVRLDGRKVPQNQSPLRLVQNTCFHLKKCLKNKNVDWWWFGGATGRCIFASAAFRVKLRSIASLTGLLYLTRLLIVWLKEDSSYIKLLKTSSGDYCEQDFLEETMLLSFVCVILFYYIDKHVLLMLEWTVPLSSSQPA